MSVIALVASGNSGFESAAMPYPAITHGLRLRLRSERRPDPSLAKFAVASAIPSIAPSAVAGSPSTIVTNAGSSA